MKTIKQLLWIPIAPLWILMRVFDFASIAFEMLAELFGRLGEQLDDFRLR